MTSPPTFLTAYTDAPRLNPNLFIGSLQLVFWLFFHPSAWRNQIARVAPTLHKDFCLIELHLNQWQNPAIRGFLLQSYWVWLLFIAGFLVLSSLLEFPSQLTTFCLAFNITICAALSVAHSVAVGVVSGVLFIIVGSVATYLKSGETLSLALGVTGSLAIGIAVNIAVSITTSQQSYSFIRQFGGIIASILIGPIFVSLVASASLSSNPLVVQLVAAVVLGVAFGTAVSLRTHQWWRSLRVGPSIALLQGVAVLSINPNVDVITINIMMGIILGIVLATILVLSYTIAERIAGSWTGAIAAALGGGSAVIAMVASMTFFSSRTALDATDSIVVIVLLGVLALLSGLTWHKCRPVLTYPLFAVWNLLLYQLDTQRRTQGLSFLRYHSAFWDEHQWLPLLGLDEHIILVAQRNPAEAQAAIDYLSTRRQRWAAQAAQIELDARQLERCRDAPSVGQIHQTLSVGELEGPADALFRSFNRISQDVDAALHQASAYNQRLALTAIGDRLDGLLRELTRSSDKYAVRFRPIAHRWCNIVALELEDLTQAAELRQEIDCPYIIGVPLTRQQEIFVGRTEIGSRIEQLLLDRRRPPLLLYGQRRTGKTSLLNNLGRLLPNCIVPLFVDLQGPASSASNHAGFLYNLAKAITKSAKDQRNLTLSPLSRADLADDPFTSFDEWLDAVEATLEENTALLAFDEFEVLDRALVEGRFSETAVLGMLRNLIQHRPRFKVLLSGSHTLAEFQRWSNYLINAQVLHLSYLKPSEARQLVERPCEGFALCYEADASQRVLDVTRGHPFLVQLLCAEIVLLKNDRDPSIRRLATLADVEAAIPEALSSGSMFFSDIERNQLDDRPLAVLRYLADRGEGATASESDLAREFPEGIEGAIELLHRRELIETTSGGYRIQVELIRRWFAD